MLDINVGRNKQLMEGWDLSIAIDNAIEYCIKQNIMRDVLEKHRSEVARLIFTEFDEVEFRQQQQKEIEDLKEQIRLAKEEIKQSREQSEKQMKLVKEEAKQSKGEAERLRKILEAHGWSE